MRSAVGIAAFVLAGLAFIAWVYAMAYERGVQHERADWFARGSTRVPAQRISFDFVNRTVTPSSVVLHGTPSPPAAGPLTEGDTQQ